MTGVKETLDRAMAWLLCDISQAVLTPGQQWCGEMRTQIFMNAVRRETCELVRLLTTARYACQLLTAALKGEKGYRGVAQSMGLLPRSSGGSVQVSVYHKQKHELLFYFRKETQ